MRQQSKIKVEVRGKTIGGENVLICLPLLGSEEKDLLQRVEELAALEPDLIEWRADGFSGAGDSKACIKLLQEFRTIIGEIPLIFTHRIDLEGGLQSLSQESRLKMIAAAIDSGQVDIVDVELCNDEQFLQAAKERANGRGVRLILSHHNFEKTPNIDFIYKKLVSAQEQGADIAKIAVMPQRSEDVLTLLSATNRARNGAVDIPMITISMAREGVITRIAGGLFGSDVTFAAGTQASAPGQIGFDDLSSTMKILI